MAGPYSSSAHLKRDTWPCMTGHSDLSDGTLSLNNHLIFYKCEFLFKLICIIFNSIYLHIFFQINIYLLAVTFSVVGVTLAIKVDT